MTEFISSIGPAVANHLWQSTVFAAVVWLVTLLLRRNPARIRYSLWLAASVKFLVPFSLLIGLGGMLPRPQRVVTAAPAAVYSAMDAVGQPFSAAVLPDEATATRVPKSGHGASAFVTVVWLCGVLVVLLVWCVRWRQVHATLRRAVPVDAGREVAILRRVDADGRIGLRLSIPLLLSRDLMEPGIFGVFRPVLLWPERLSERLEDEHIEAIMAHELMHVQRRDNLTAMLHMAVEAAFWFHPIVWWMERRMVEERERACDEAVVQMGGSAEAYAESLLKACRFCVESPMVCVSGITGADLCKRVRSIMTLRLEKLGPMRKSALALLTLAAVAGPVVFGARYAEVRAAQTVNEDWQKAAGGKMEFEVASVRLDPESHISGNFRLSPDDAYTPTGGLLNADYALTTYIDFAYKIWLSREQAQMMYGHLPKWVQTDTYEIHARAPGQNPTKDQMRLMMQSLLKQRFGLVVHLETQDTPVLEMTLMKPGTLGPQLRRHEDGPACDVTGTRKPGTELKDTDIFPSQCGGVEAENRPNQTILMGSRNTTLGEIAESFEVGRVGRPVVDETGLTGEYDFRLTWTPNRGDFGSASRATSPDEPAADAEGTPFLEAVKEQLGLKLKPGKAPLKALVIDHVERPAGDAGGEVPQAKDVPAQVRAQDQAADMAVRPPEFQVATIKPSKDTSGDSGTTLFGNEYEANNKTLEDIIRSAYGITSGGKDRLSGGPGWINSTRFDIKAKLAESDVAELQKLPREQQLKRSQLMLQALLATRFKLKVHHETKELPVYVLTVAKSSPKLTPSSPSESQNQHGVRAGRGQITGMDAKLDTFVNVLGMQPEIGRLVFDKTGLTGSYDFTLRWTPEGMAGRDSAPPPDSPWPSFFTALQEQLGLKLELTKGPVDTIVIDSVEMPSAN